MKPFVIDTQVSKAESPMYVVVDKDSLGIVIEPLHSNFLLSRSFLTYLSVLLSPTISTNDS